MKCVLFAAESGMRTLARKDSKMADNRNTEQGSKNGVKIGGKIKWPTTSKTALTVFLLEQTFEIVLLLFWSIMFDPNFCRIGSLCGAGAEGRGREGSSIFGRFCNIVYQTKRCLHFFLEKFMIRVFVTRYAFRFKRHVIESNKNRNRRPKFVLSYAKNGTLSKWELK